MEPIYLDHNATTPIHPEVVEAMNRCHARGYANPASQHIPGQQARKVLEDARERIAELLGANLTCPQPDKLIFTGSATEANNLAVLGIAQAHGYEPRQLVISAVEHPSVIGPAEHLLERGWRLDTLAIVGDGVVRGELLAGLLGESTRVVSVMLGNHDTGAIQPVAELAEECNRAGVPLHTDAVQAVGKMPVNFRRLGVAAMSAAAHKFGGPLGIGALILRHDAPIVPITFGGSQQSGLRPGTEPVALAVGMMRALEIHAADASSPSEKCNHILQLAQLRDRFESALKAGISGIVIHGQSSPRLPQTSSIAFPAVDGQVFLIALSMAGVACSVGSACSSGAAELSPTLRAMGIPTEMVGRSLRFSLGYTTTEAEIDEAVRRIVYVWYELAQ
jgi:cysteine desulfurase